MFNLSNLLRENIKKAKPYSSARDEYKGSEGTFLDANENPHGSATPDSWNRYPDPLQHELKDLVSALKRVRPQQIFFGNGSDEPIDLLIRAVCNPGKDNIITLPPTYGMYEVSAGINDVKIIEVPLDENYHMRPDEILKAVNENTKIIFICSPNNPTGNSMRSADVVKVLENFNGIVVIDEAYIDFAPDRGFSPKLDQYKNLVVLQTFSKAWGMASLRLGMAFASEEIINVLNKIKPPYNINGATQKLALEGIRHLLKKEKMVAEILGERDRLAYELPKLPLVIKVFPSDANFLLVKTKYGHEVYKYLIDQQIITRDRSNVKFCEGSLRVSVGTTEENDRLLKALAAYPEK